MAEILFNVNMDLVDKYTPAEDITIPQEDDLSVKFVYSIFNREVAEDLTGATDIVVSFVKPDGHIVLQSNGTLALPNKVEIVANAQAFTYVGKVYMQVQYKKVGQTYNTRQAFFWVEKSGTSCTTVASSDYAPYLDNIMNTWELLSAVDLQALIDSKVTAENAQADIDILTPRVITLETSYTALAARVAAAETDITAIKGVNTAQDTRLTTLETAKIANDTKNTAQDNRLTAIESGQTTQDNRLTSIETKNTTQDTRLTTIETATSGIPTMQTDITTIKGVNTTQDSRIGALETAKTANDTKNATQDTNIGNNASAISALQTSQATQDTKIANLESGQGTANTRMTAIETKNTQQDGRLTAIETVNTTQDTDIATIKTKNTTQDTRLTALEDGASALSATVAANKTAQDTVNTSTASSIGTLNTKMTAVETKNTQQDTRLDTTETKNTTQDTRLATLEGVNTNVIADITALETLTGEHESRLDTNDTKNSAQDSLIASNTSAISSLTTTVNNNQTSMNTRVTALETAKAANDTKNTQQDSRLTALENYDTTQDTRMTAIEGINTTQNARMDTIEAKNAQQDNNLDIVNIANFGAVGGTTNDATAVISAIAHAKANNKTTIYVPFSQLTLSPSIDFQGLSIKGNNTSLSLGSTKNTQKLINCIINGVSSLDEPVFTPPMVGSTSPKVIARLSDTSHRLITKKASGRGYVSYVIEKGIGTTTNSIGAPFDLRRVTNVNDYTDAWVYKHTRSGFDGNWTDYSFASEVGRPLRYWRLQSVTGTEWVEFDVQVDETGKFNMGFYSTAGSDSNAPIIVDGVEVARLDLTRNPNSYFTETFTAKTGLRKVRIGFSGAVGRYMMVAGVNFYQLSQADITKEYDFYSYWNTTNDYIYNKGALDYAMVDNDTGQYCGSYHGGEVGIREEIRLDSTPTTFTTNGEFKVCKLVEFNQTTKIVDKLTSETIQRFNEDGVFDFLCNMNGNMNVSTFYNCMSTTSDSFTQLVYPKRMAIDVAQDYTIGRANVLIQENPVTNQRITTHLTLFNNDSNRNGGTIIRRVVGGYNKIYYGKYVYSLGNVSDLNFRTVRIFE